MAPDRRHRGGDETSHGRGARAMKLAKVLILSLIGAAISASAAAQAPMQISPPAARPPANIPKPAQKTKAAKRPVLKKSIEPALAAPAKQIPAPSAPTAFAPDHPPIAPFAAPDKPAPPSNTKTTALQPQASVAEQGDVAYGAYQRGYYLEAFKEATRRAGEGDPVAMTLLGDLYSNGYGIPKDDKKALAWFSLAADRGDKQAIFSLAMAKFAGRGTAQDLPEAAALLEKAAKLGHVAAAYNLALLYLEGRQVRQD